MVRNASPVQVGPGAIPKDLQTKKKERAQQLRLAGSLREASVSESSRMRYQDAWNRFVAFCKPQNPQKFNASRLDGKLSSMVQQMVFGWRGPEPGPISSGCSSVLHAPLQEHEET